MKNKLFGVTVTFIMQMEGDSETEVELRARYGTQANIIDMNTTAKVLDVEVEEIR